MDCLYDDRDTAITDQGLPPALEGAQGDADLATGAERGCTSGMRLADQLKGLEPVSGAGQPSTYSEQKASNFFRSTSKTTISAMAFSVRCNSFLKAL
jgi:hypothetical protein